MNITRLIGKDKLEDVTLDSKHNRNEIVNLDGLFVEVGSIPNLYFLKDINIETDEKGYIKVNKDQSINIQKKANKY